MTKRKPVRVVPPAVPLVAEREQRPPVEAIRAAAFAQFAERGYPVVTVRDIMKACGLTQGALYNHFKSKDELLHDIIASTQGELERLCQQAVAGAGDDPRAKLAAFVRVYVVRHCRLRVEALVANREIGWLDPVRVADIRRSRRAIRDIVVGILVQGVERGLFDPPQVDGRRDLKAIAMALLDQCTHVSMWYGPGGELGEEQMAGSDMALRRRSQTAVSRSEQEPGHVSRVKAVVLALLLTGCTWVDRRAAGAPRAPTRQRRRGADRSLAGGADRRDCRQPAADSSIRRCATGQRGVRDIRIATSIGRRPSLVATAANVSGALRAARRGVLIFITSDEAASPCAPPGDREP
jgi:AcrR family transcriptional regulator